MSSVKTIFVKTPKPAWLHTGPTPANPGPTLLKHAITDDTLVIKPYGLVIAESIDTSMIDTNTINAYKTKYLCML